MLRIINFMYVCRPMYVCITVVYCLNETTFPNPEIWIWANVHVLTNARTACIVLYCTCNCIVWLHCVALGVANADAVILTLLWRVGLTAWTVAMCPYYVIVHDMVSVEVACKVGRRRPLRHGHTVACASPCVVVVNTDAFDWRVVMRIGPMDVDRGNVDFRRTLSWLSEHVHRLVAL